MILSKPRPPRQAIVADCSNSTTNEKRLGRIVRTRYETDYFIIDKFPMALRPFYTMPDSEDPVCSVFFLHMPC